MQQIQARKSSRTSPGSQSRLEILPVSILETHADKVREFEHMARVLGKSFGWHYKLDLAWAAAEVEEFVKPGGTVLEAGAGTGLMQWWLADHGVNVISVDRMPRYFTPAMRAWCPIVDYSSGQAGLTPSSLKQTLSHVVARRPYAKRSLACIAATTRDSLLRRSQPGPRSTVRVLEGDLQDLREVEGECVDAVVSISSLEHNSPENLSTVVQELTRVLRPGGRIIATVGGARDRDWYHEPSSGWCYTEESLRRIFELDADCPSNYSSYDELFEQLVNCDYLRNNLGEFYFRDGRNGMPWGRWDPQYQSVGVVKAKSP